MALVDKVVKVLAERQAVYGSPVDEFELTARFDQLIMGLPECAEKVALHNIGQKVVRLIFGISAVYGTTPTDAQARHIIDSWTDIAGYALCGLQCSDAAWSHAQEPLAKEEPSYPTVNVQITGQSDLLEAEIAQALRKATEQITRETRRARGDYSDDPRPNGHDGVVVTDYSLDA